MANEFKHADPGATLTEAQFIGTDRHICDSQAQGDIIYFNGTGWVRLPAGTSGKWLITQGAGANPAWSSALASPTLSGTVAGTPTWVSAQAITLSTAAQPNITSLGTLTGLAVQATSIQLINGQTVNIAITTQTVGATTLTIPNFAGVSDTIAFITLAQTLVNKTLTAPIINGTVTTTGLTMPAFTMGGDVSGTSGLAGLGMKLAFQNISASGAAWDLIITSLDSAKKMTTIQLFPYDTVQNDRTELSLEGTPYAASIGGNYERLYFEATSTAMIITSENKGTGTLRPLQIGMSPTTIFTPSLTMNTDSTVTFSYSVLVGATGSPATSDASSKVIQLGNAFLQQNVVGSQGMLSYNAHYDGVWKYVIADVAMAIRYNATIGAITFVVAPSGAAGATIANWDGSNIKLTFGTNTVTWANIYHVGLKFGLAGTATGAYTMDGATSGTVTMTVAAAAGTWTMTLPTAVGTAGYQLTDAAGNGVCSWAAAGSLREYKVLGAVHPAQEALDKILATKVYDFHYREGKGTGDTLTAYVGLVAEEAPWAMHYRGGVLNPINALGYTILAFQAQEKRIQELERELAKLKGAG